VKASNALAPRSFLEQCETLRAITAGRRSVPPVVGVGSNSVLPQKPQHMSFVVLGTHPVQHASDCPGRVNPVRRWNVTCGIVEILYPFPIVRPRQCRPSSAANANACCSSSFSCSLKLFAPRPVFSSATALALRISRPRAVSRKGQLSWIRSPLGCANGQQAFLARQPSSSSTHVVTPAPVADHETPAEIDGDEFPYLLVAMLRSDLIDRKRSAHKRHQKAPVRLPSRQPRVVGMHLRACSLNRGAQRLISSTHRVFACFIASCVIAP